MANPPPPPAPAPPLRPRGRPARPAPDARDPSARERRSQDAGRRGPDRPGDPPDRRGRDTRPGGGRPRQARGGGPATVAWWVAGGNRVEAEAWGPGADRILDAVPALIGQDDDRSGFEPR